jgi:hypothetical protein
MGFAQHASAEGLLHKSHSLPDCCQQSEVIMQKHVWENIDVTKTNILFKNNYFKNSTFKFGWAGYAGKNKLGFQMVKKG